MVVCGMLLNQTVVASHKGLIVGKDRNQVDQEPKPEPGMSKFCEPATKTPTWNIKSIETRSQNQNQEFKN